EVSVINPEGGMQCVRSRSMEAHSKLVHSKMVLPLPLSHHHQPLHEGQFFRRGDRYEDREESHASGSNLAENGQNKVIHEISKSLRVLSTASIFQNTHYFAKCALSS
ncbi:MAG: hypothetical protein ACFFB3_13690, partial [Candidatus Hodarchaeota archaeon]